MKLLPSRFQRHHFFFLIFTILFLVRIAGRLRYFGILYRFNNDIFHPDGVCYTAHTLRLIGRTNEQILRTLIPAYAHYGPNSPKIDLISITIGCQSTNGRILYSIVSVPFVWIFGAIGMVVVPALSTYILTISPLYMAAKREVSTVTLCLLSVIVICSNTIFRWGVSNLTDPLLALIFFLGFLVRLKLSNSTSKQSRFYFSCIFLFVIVCGSLTRRSFPIWLLLTVFPFSPKIGSASQFWRYCQKVDKKFLIAGTVFVGMADKAISLIFGAQNGAAAVTGIQNSLFPENLNSSAVSNDRYFVGVAKAFVHLFYGIVKTTFVDLGELAVLDIGLLFLVCLAIYFGICSGASRMQRWTIYILGVQTLLAGLNGTLGVNFRFQFPALAFVIFSAAQGLQSLGKREVKRQL